MNLVSGVHKNFRHTQQAQVCLNMNDLLVDTRLSRVKNPSGQIPAQSQKRKDVTMSEIPYFRFSVSVFSISINYIDRYLLSDRICWFINISKVLLDRSLKQNKKVETRLFETVKTAAVYCFFWYEVVFPGTKVPHFCVKKHFRASQFYSYINFWKTLTENYKKPWFL